MWPREKFLDLLQATALNSLVLLLRFYREGGEKRGSSIHSESRIKQPNHVVMKINPKL